MIHVRRLRKSYQDLQTGTFTALDGISFDAMPGQIYGLLGPNGAGKTTALRILSTVLKPTSGTAVINGFDVNKSPEKIRHQIGDLRPHDGVGASTLLWPAVRDGRRNAANANGKYL